jgi:adenylate cyclase
LAEPTTGLAPPRPTLAPRHASRFHAGSLIPPPHSAAPRTFELLPAAAPDQEIEAEIAALQLAQGDQSGSGAAILIADDHQPLRQAIAANLELLGYKNLAEAEDGRQTLEELHRQNYDLLILDIDMPHLSGFDVLTTLKADPARRHIPVIVASGNEHFEAVVRCIQLGAEDFLPKPINSILLSARIGASLERKRLRDLERLRLLEIEREKRRVEAERERSDRLLLNVLPASIATRLKQGEQTIADHHAAVTVLFADLVDSIPLAHVTAPADLVALLNDLFSRFDELAVRHGLEKIKTIGDSYLAVAGLPQARPDHALAAAAMSLDMIAAVAQLNRDRGTHLAVRIGINSGPVVAGVIGHQKFSYDLWGATVNLAHRMQSSGQPGRVHLTAATAELIHAGFVSTAVGLVDCKGLGKVQSCLLESRR